MTLGACVSTGDAPPEPRDDETSPAAASNDRSPEAAGFPTTPADVAEVVDGDTIRVRLDGGRIERVRLIGVDTPESTTRVDPYGKEAAAYTTRALTSKRVFLELDVEQRDRFGRLLAYVWLARPLRGDEPEVRAGMFNARLLMDGFAQILTVPPNVKYAELFRGLQAEARIAGKGLWGLAPRAAGACDPAYPDFCIPPPPPDLDCPDVGRRNFRVRSPDPHGLDGDHDGIGCES